MLALVIVLVATNLGTAAAVIVLLRRHAATADRDTVADPQIAQTIAASGNAASAGGRTRRVISVEILNPIELASVRGRVFGIAGSFVPHLTRRIVYDQTVRQLREQLAAHRVVADVQVHVLAPGRSEASTAAQPIRLDVTMDAEAVLEPDPAYDPPVQ